MKTASPRRCSNSLRRSHGPWQLAAGLLLLAMASAGLAAKKGWISAYESGPFQIRAEFSLEDSQPYLDSLGELRDDIAAALEIQLSDEPVEVLLFSSRWSFRSYLSDRVPEGMGRPALYVKGDNTPGRVYAYAGGDMQINVRHECTHATLHAALEILPIWLDEGFAKYFEVPAADRAGRHGYLRQVKLGSRLGWRADLANLESNRTMEDMSAADYRDAWATVHFMLHGPPEAHETLVRYLTDIQEGNPPGRLSDRLEEALPGIERRIVQHFRSWK